MFNQAYLSEIEERVFKEGRKLKEKGTIFIGMYCAFTPGELIGAAGAIPVSLCAGSQKPIETAEKHLPRNLCPLIKSSYGHALQDSCPYLHFCDMVFADATCDGKKKMFELLSHIRSVHVLQLPQTYQTEESVTQWRHELEKMKSTLEILTGCKINSAAIREQIRLYNRHKRTVNQVYSLNKGDVPLLYGREIDVITGGGGFNCNLSQRIKEMEAAIETVKARAEDEAFTQEVKHKPRILLTGCPSTNKKLLNVIEESGGMVVAMENCGGLKTAGDYTNEDGDPMQALAERYLKIACPCMTPNPKRFKLIEGFIQDYRIDGVVELTWQGCHTYNVESFFIRNFVQEQCKKPYIKIETDYTENDVEQIRVRIQAFLEMIS